MADEIGVADAAGRAAFTLRYRSRRSEVWTLYWRRWRSGLWRPWLLTIVLTAAIVPYLLGQSHPSHWPSRHDVFVAGLAILAILAFFAAYPQMMFKPQERALTVGPDGIDTTIGARSAHRAWSDIGTIADDGDVITLVVARTGNAFVVPTRAFHDATERNAFLRSAMAWHKAARP